jgi:parvulin-like peptidyl-prolyl isomerase
MTNITVVWSSLTVATSRRCRFRSTCIRSSSSRPGFQDYYGERAQGDVAKTFGTDFARALFGLAPEAWAGPIESGYGWHLVWVDSITPARVPDFEEVEPEVETAWTEAQRAEIREKAFAAMRARYQVVVPKELPSIELPSVAGIAPE